MVGGFRRPKYQNFLAATHPHIQVQPMYGSTKRKLDFNYNPAQTGTRRIVAPKANNARTFADKVARLARKVMNSKPSRVKTKTRPRSMKKRALTYTQGYSGGKFSRKEKGDRFAAYSAKGCVLTREVGCLATGQSNTRPLFVGHATHCNFGDITDLFFRTMVRTLFNKHGLEILDLEAEGPGDYQIVCEYVVNDATSTTSFNQTTAALSYLAIATAIKTQWTTIFATTGARQLFYFTNVELRQTIGNQRLVKIDYFDCYMSIMSKSDLKIQNRTIALGTDEDANSSDNVANQPLSGKIYSGKGNGLLAKVDSLTTSAGKSLICSEDKSNLLAYSPGALDYWLEEPPLPSLFTPKPQYANARIEPGQIRTNVLIDTWKVKQTEFWQLATGLAGASRNNGVQIQNRYGRFSIFALEKMICVTELDSNPIVGLECNTRIGMFFNFKRKKFNAEITEPMIFTTQLNGPN